MARKLPNLRTFPFMASRKTATLEVVENFFNVAYSYFNSPMMWDDPVSAPMANVQTDCRIWHADLFGEVDRPAHDVMRSTPTDVVVTRNQVEPRLDRGVRRAQEGRRSAHPDPAN